MTLNDPKPERWNNVRNPDVKSRSSHSLTLNISEIAKDTAIITMEGEWETVLKLSNGVVFNDLE